MTHHASISSPLHPKIKTTSINLCHGLSWRTLLKVCQLGVGDLATYSHHLLGKNDSSKSRNFKGVEVLAVYSPVANIGGGLVLEINADEIFSPITVRSAPNLFNHWLLIIFLWVKTWLIFVQSVRNIIVSVFCVALGLTLLISYLFAYSTLLPLRHLHEATIAIAKGDLSTVGQIIEYVEREN